ncbi:voltage-gated potassium channel [Aurantimicrobium minutum]|uniref:pH-gated potassium channel KcsA n=1 Tax=Aurantimicrobium photophilum TaxID=1987356 RepID=A0A2Z3RWW6_9MICO|nr:MULTISPECIES: potassium channel family protein [Aurantimicrobium]AWR21030.1 pH-gated potassium channel KcsA [Aurantimicrobium photophilum]MDH6425106.1 voltage-gated potassium channel [Aurantimicrobium minutum]
MESTPKPVIMNAAGVLVEDTRSPKEIKWEKFTTLPFIFLSFIFLLGYSVLILNDEVFTQGIDKYILLTLGVIWIMFIIDYFVRLTLSTNKRIFFKRNVIDLISMAIPFTRPFLLLMYLSRLRWFRGRQGSSVRARLVAYAASFALMYIYVLSLAVYAAERNAAGATILNYGDSVWWAIETITTVGYGDMIPVTIAGRVYASLLMLGGVVIVGATTATVISYLSEKVQTVHKKSQEHAAHLNDTHKHDDNQPHS